MAEPRARRHASFVRVRAALGVAFLLAACDGDASRIEARPDAGMPANDGGLLPDGRRIVPSGNAAPARACAGDAECPAGSGAGRCGSIGDYGVCVVEVAPAMGPSASSAVDECDGDRLCPAGATCYESTVYPSGQCGLGGASLQNVCRRDECTSDADCARGLCGPPGLSSGASLGGGFVRQCFEADCRSDADCGAREGGACALVEGRCELAGVGTLQQFRPARLACVYPDGCTAHSDCPAGAECRVVSGAAVCVARP